MKVVKWISWEEAEEMPEAINLFGGFFTPPMRWGSYVEVIHEQWGVDGLCTVPEDFEEYLMAIREEVVERGIRHGGDWHQNDEEGVPVFEDGYVARFSYRGWGDLMAAIWSTVENKDYGYMDFYMDATMGRRGDTGE